MSASDVRVAVRQLMSAANRLDLDGFVGMFQRDADFHNPIGMVLQGRAEIRALHEKLYSSDPPPGFPTFANVRSSGEIRAVRLVGDGVAIADWAWRQQGAQADGSEWPSRSGTTTTVWSRDGDARWRVVAWRDKDFPAGYRRPPGY
ncbi:SgcJ/EcaC family oxidoreductase [Saccharopolyspora sp. K220]|uniref:YybH family protein n=1 Tax=Saccharopolyspora soli TaxID=2926618 RepID=UPI001F57FDB8|nr:SgcJ/EcaC family oxidoreductase [Saccharopolyspora soli]MCI2416756.1 SgcJ/EcaC family oxidoreductase [Saccharopolyspora soli]